jgi:uncharacterized membrane protein YdjX (TVP38/TMEM64 family)
MSAVPGSHSLVALGAWLFLDGVTFSFATTPLLLRFGQWQPAWAVALVGGVASAAGSTVQLVLLRWVLSERHAWTRRFAPSREKIEQAVAAHPSASFLAVFVARAPPLPDAPLKQAAAVTGYPVVPYGVAVLLGALPYYFALALLGSRFRFPTWLLVALVATVVVAFALEKLRQRRRPA